MKLLMLSRVTEAGKLLEEAALGNDLEVQIIDPGKIFVADGEDGCQHFYHVKSVDETDPIEISKPDMIMFRDGTVDMFLKFAFNKTFSDIATMNCYEAIESCRHKYMTQLLLNQAGIKTPKSTLVTKVEQLDGALKFLGDKFPKIMKTVTGSKGVGVIKVDSKESLKSVLQVVLLSNDEVMIQEMLIHKEDYRILTIGEEPIAFVRREIQDGEFRSNLDHSKKAETKSVSYQDTPVDKLKEEQENEYKPSQKELDLSVKIAKLLKCEVSAIDYAIDGEDIIVFEVNTSPGLEGIQSVNKNIDIADLVIKHLIKLFDQRKQNQAPGETAESPPTDVIVNNGVLTTNITIKRINDNQPFLCKIDTGAEKSWLDANDVAVNKTNNTVTFTVNDTKYRINVERLATIRFAGGTHMKEDVPIILLDIVHHGKTIKDVEFIIGERKSKYQVLLGRKALEQMNLILKFDPETTRNIELETEKQVKDESNSNQEVIDETINKTT